MLAAQDLLRIWERGLAHPHPLDRALNILAAAYPELTYDALVRLSIGQRDARLLDVHEALFGTHLPCFASCPACNEALEFTLNLSDMRAAAPPQTANALQQFAADGYVIAFRLLDSLDLAAVAQSDLTSIPRLLLRRAISSVRHQDRDVPFEDVPAAVLEALEQAMAERDLQAEMRLHLTCPVCGQQWMLSFDIVSYLWNELSARARLLLREVHILAGAYGWREADILALSPVRRQLYLELVGR